MQELHLLEDWFPEHMEPGTLFVLANAGQVGPQEDAYFAVMACPSCATLGLITQKQFRGKTEIICGAKDCSAEFRLRGDEIEWRKPQ